MGRLTGMQRVGDIDAMRKLVQRAKPLTDAERKLDQAAAEIAAAPDDVDAGFMAWWLVQCTLPHRNPGDAPIWTRRNGGLTLSIVPGIDDDGHSYGYPFGSLPRLVLLWMVTEAVRTKQRRLNLGPSLSQFMAELGLSPDTGRGKRGDAKRLRDQMIRLFQSRIGFDFKSRDGDKLGSAWLRMEVAPAGQLWWDPTTPNQAVLWGSWIELGEKFYQAVTASPVPFDLRHVRALKRSPLALDMYLLLNYLGATLKQSKPITWGLLHEQLGGDYGDLDNFTRKASAALVKVKKVHPGLNVEKLKRGGIKVHPSPPAVPRLTAKV